MRLLPNQTCPLNKTFTLLINQNQLNVLFRAIGSHLHPGSDQRPVDAAQFQVRLQQNVVQHHLGPAVADSLVHDLWTDVLGLDLWKWNNTFIWLNQL